MVVPSRLCMPALTRHGLFSLDFANRQSSSDTESSRPKSCTRTIGTLSRAGFIPVATVRRDFDATLTFYQIQTLAAQQGEVWPARRLRTTSPLEREFRAVRRRVANAVLFHSPSGLAAVFHQLVIRRAAHRSNALPGSWQRCLEQALAQVSRIS